MKVYALNNSAILGNLQCPLNALRVRYDDDGQSVYFYTYDTPIFTKSFKLTDLEDEIGGTFATLDEFKEYLSKEVFLTSGGAGGTLSVGATQELINEINTQGQITVIYSGSAKAGAITSVPVWRISKTTISTQGQITTTLVEYPVDPSNDPDAFAYIWDNRTILTYQ